MKLKILRKTTLNFVPFVLILFIFTAFSSVVSLSSALTWGAGRSYALYERLNKNALYRISDAYLEHEDYKEFMSDNMNLEKVMTFYNGLTQFQDIEIIHTYRQPIALGIKLPSQFHHSYAVTYDYGQETITDLLQVPIKSVQVSKGTVNYYNLQLRKGNFFENYKLSYEEGAELPIILGSAYDGIIDVGTVIPGKYLFRNFNFKVIGILDEQAFVNVFAETVYLFDRVLLPVPEHLWSPEQPASMPTTALQEQLPEDFYFQKTLYLSMLNFDIASDLSLETLIGRLEKLAEASSFYGYEFVNVPSFLFKYNVMSKVLGNNILLLLFLGISTYILMLLTLYGYLTVDLEFNYSLYVVYWRRGYCKFSAVVRRKLFVLLFVGSVAALFVPLLLLKRIFILSSLLPQLFTLLNFLFLYCLLKKRVLKKYRAVK